MTNRIFGIMLCICFLSATASFAKAPPSSATELAATGNATANATAKTQRHIYLLIGQSNMAGRAPFTKAQAAPIERGYLLNDKDQWEPAANPLNRYSTIRKGIGMQKMNPGYSFAMAMLNDQIAKVPKTVALTGYAKSQGLSAMDRWHFDAKNMQILGQRYAQEMLKIQASLKARPKQSADTN